MKGTVAAGAILGVLAIGGLPALAHTMAGDQPTADQHTAAAGAAAEWQPGDGAPPWSNGHHGDKADKADKEKALDNGAAAKKRRSGDLPPGLARKGKAHHGAEMRVWAHCRAGAEKPAAQKRCGAKPTPPGDDAPDD